MKDRRVIYDELVAYYTSRELLPGASIKVTQKEGLEVTTIKVTASRMPVEGGLTQLQALRKHIAEHGWKTPVDTPWGLVRAPLSKCAEIYRTILFDSKTGKISVGQFEMGIGWHKRQQRYYPIRRNYPEFTLTDNLYCFYRLKRKAPLAVRMWIGETPWVDNRVAKLFLDLPYNLDYVRGLTYKNLVGTTSYVEAIERKFKLKIPKVLQEMNCKSLVEMCKLLEPNDFNRLCQTLAQIPEKSSHHSYKASQFRFLKDAGDKYTNEKLVGLIGTTMFGENFDLPHDASPTIPDGKSVPFWLLRDYIDDLLHFKKKLSLKITSRKRIDQEHREYSIRRRMEGIKKLTPNKVYEKVLEGLPYSWEFIKTPKRLVEEGTEMSHCVANYARQINAGYSGIYSIVFANKRYTLELNRIDETDQFFVGQCRGFQNCEAPAELMADIHNLPNVWTSEWAYRNTRPVTIADGERVAVAVNAPARADVLVQVYPPNQNELHF